MATAKGLYYQSLIMKPGASPVYQDDFEEPTHTIGDLQHNIETNNHQNLATPDKECSYPT